MAIQVKCPTCKKPAELGTKWFPFCSERCQLIDLGRWANEEYRIPVAGPAPVELKPIGADDEEEEEQD
jgi:hypothetical protein